MSNEELIGKVQRWAQATVYGPAFIDIMDLCNLSKRLLAGDAARLAGVAARLDDKLLCDNPHKEVGEDAYIFLCWEEAWRGQDQELQLQRLEKVLFERGKE